MLCSWSSTAGQPQQALCAWNLHVKGGWSLRLLRKISPEDWPSSCAWTGQQNHSMFGPTWDQTCVATFNIVNPCLNWEDFSTHFYVQCRDKYTIYDMHIFLLWCHQLFFISFLCFPSPFIAQVWHFRCTKAIEFTFPLQSEGVWVSNISFTDFFGGKNHFFLREKCTKLAEIKGPVKKLKGPQHGLYRGAQRHRRTVS